MDIFNQLDEDRSGFLDKEELYVLFQKAKVGGPTAPPSTISRVSHTDGSFLGPPKARSLFPKRASTEPGGRHFNATPSCCSFCVIHLITFATHAAELKRPSRPSPPPSHYPPPLRHGRGAVAGLRSTPYEDFAARAEAHLNAEGQVSFKGFLLPREGPQGKPACRWVNPWICGLAPPTGPLPFKSAVVPPKDPIR